MQTKRNDNEVADTTPAIADYMGAVHLRQRTLIATVQLFEQPPEFDRKMGTQGWKSFSIRNRLSLIWIGLWRTPD